MNPQDAQIAQNKRLVAQLLAAHAGRYPSWEQERARQKLEAEKAEKERADRERALAEVRAEQAAAHEKTQALPGITMPERESIPFVDPIAVVVQGKIEPVDF